MKTYTGGLFSRVSLATGRPGADVGVRCRWVCVCVCGRGLGGGGNTCQRAHLLPTVPQAPCHTHSHSPFYSHVCATGTMCECVCVRACVCLCRVHAQFSWYHIYWAPAVYIIFCQLELQKSHFKVCLFLFQSCSTCHFVKKKKIFQNFALCSLESDLCLQLRRRTSHFIIHCHKPAELRKQCSGVCC